MQKQKVGETLQLSAADLVRAERLRTFVADNLEALEDLMDIRGGSATLHFDDTGKIRKVESHRQKRY